MMKELRFTFAAAILFLVMAVGQAFVLPKGDPPRAAGATLSTEDQTGLNGVVRQVGEVRLNEKAPKLEGPGKGETATAAQSIVEGAPAASTAAGAAAVVAGGTLPETEAPRHPVVTIGIGLFVFLSSIGAVLGLRWWMDKAGPQMPVRQTLKW